MLATLPCYRALASSPAEKPLLFDRKHEMNLLKRLLKQRGQLLLITGPPDCGKSAILRQIAQDEEGVSLINLRTGDFSTGQSFTRELKMELGRHNKQLLAGLENLHMDFSVQLLGSSIGFPTENQEHLEFQKLFLDYLRTQKSQTVPTIVIDEANVLQVWRKGDANQSTLSSFLRFFVAITKEMDLANVVLATSDYFFKFWLDKRIGASRYMKGAIGDFTEADARCFFDHMLGYSCPSEIWKDVFNVCGGRALLLKRSANYILSGGNVTVCWPEFRQVLFDHAYDEVYSGLDPDELTCWTSEDYEQIVREMCKYRDGVMPWKDFKSLPACGTNAVKALICHNLVHYRARSALARDLDWYTGPWPVVMPMSRVHFLVMQALVAGNS